MPNPAKITIIVNSRPHHLDSSDVTPVLLRSLAELPDDYEAWQIVGSPDPEGGLPKDDVQVTGPITAKSGDRFRVVPPGTFGQTASPPSALDEELRELHDALGLTPEVLEDGEWTVLIFPNWPLPTGYSKKATRLLVRIPRSYPNGKPDMFWTDADVRKENGVLPERATSDSVLGKEWLRFSWHSQKWDPARDNLRSFLAFVDSGLFAARR